MVARKHHTVGGVAKWLIYFAMCSWSYHSARLTSGCGCATFEVLTNKSLHGPAEWVKLSVRCPC